MATLGDMVVRIVGDTTQFDKAVGDSKVGFANIEKAAVAMAAVVAGTFVKLVNDTVKYGSAVYDAAQKTGLSTDAIQKWQFITKQTGTTLETVTTAVAAMTRGLDTNEKKFASLGVTLKNQDGTFRSITEIFDETILKLAAMKDETARDAITFDIFGRGAQGLIPILKEGSAGIKSMSDEAVSLGVVMDGSAIRAAEGLGDSVAALKDATGAAGRSLVSGFVPALQAVADSGTTALKSIVRAKNASKELLDGQRLYDNWVTGKTLSTVDELQAAYDYLSMQIQALSASSATAGQVVSQGLNYKLRDLATLLQIAKERSKEFKPGADMAEQATEYVGAANEVIATTKEMQDAVDATVKAMGKNWESTFTMMFRASKPIFEMMGEMLIDESLGWDDLATVAVNSIGNIVSAIGDELAAKAAARTVEAIAALVSIVGAPLAPGLFASAAVLAGGAAAAWVAGGALKATKFAEGGIVMPQAGGVPAILAEAGQPEVVFPLEKLERFLSGTGGGTPEGDIRLVVNLDSQPFLDKIFPATRNRTILISAGAVV